MNDRERIAQEAERTRSHLRPQAEEIFRYLYPSDSDFMAAGDTEEDVIEDIVTWLWDVGCDTCGSIAEYADAYAEYLREEGEAW